MLGTTVGNYVITQELGAGGMGAVYLAEHPEIGRQVAVKVLAAQLHHEQLAQRFLSEAKVLARIDHDNVIDIFDFGRLPDGRLYYVMELLKGRELREVLQERETFSAQQVLPYLEQICAGLTAAHQAGIIHRDLKPENIFVLEREQLRVKLLDFGIAKVLEPPPDASVTATGMVMGTPIYIAPEQAAGESDRISPQTDIYSLGVILYAMLAGRPPFLGNAPGLLLAQHISALPTPLSQLVPTIPSGLAQVVDACLAKDPTARAASAQELFERFKAASDASGAAATEGVPPGRPASHSAAQAPTTGAPTTGAPTTGAPTTGAPTIGGSPASGVASRPETAPFASHGVPSTSSISLDTLPGHRPKRLVFIALTVLVGALGGIGYLLLRDHGSAPAPVAKSQAPLPTGSQPATASKLTASGPQAQLPAAAAPKASPPAATVAQRLAVLAKAYQGENYPQAAKLAEQLWADTAADARQRSLASLYGGAIHLQLRRQQEAKLAFSRALEADPTVALPPGMPAPVARAFAARRCRVLGKGCPTRRKTQRRKVIDTRLKAPAYPGSNG